MATATITVTNAELINVLSLGTTSPYNYNITAATPAAIDAAAAAYVSVIMNKNTTFEPLGRQLRRFANTHNTLLRASIA